MIATASIPRAFLHFARKDMHRTGRPFLLGPLRDSDWPIEAYEWSRATYVLLLDRSVGQRLYDIERGTTEELLTLTGAIVVALEGLPSRFASDGHRGRALSFPAVARCWIPTPPPGDVPPRWDPIQGRPTPVSPEQVFLVQTRQAE